MKLIIVEEKKARLVFDLEGENPTMISALKEELWQDEHVKAAGFTVEHPLIEKPRFVLETDGADPRKTVSAAIKRMQKEIAKLKDGFKGI